MFKSANVGRFDQIFRIILGALLIAAPYFYAHDIWNDQLYRIGIPVVGAILVVTALIRFCPLYKIIGLRTCS